MKFQSKWIEVIFYMAIGALIALTYVWFYRVHPTHSMRHCAEAIVSHGKRLKALEERK